MVRNINKLLRITAWLLLFATIIAIFSGFFITKYFLFPWNYELSKYLHTILVPLIFIPLFYLHSLFGILVLMRRMNIKKKFIKISAVLFWSLIFVAFIFFYAVGAPEANISPDLSEQGSNLTISEVSVSEGYLLLNLSEVNKHSSSQDCWLIINSKVYDVTDYLRYHPGSPETIIKYCGTYATEAFDTKDERNPKKHSPDAYSLLDKFYIGDVGTKISKKKTQEIIQQQKISFSDMEKTLFEKFPDSEIISLKPKKNGEYEAKLVYEGILYEIKLDSDGNIRNAEIEDD